MNPVPLLAVLCLAAASPAAALPAAAGAPWRPTGVAVTVTGPIALTPGHFVAAGADFPLRLVGQASFPVGETRLAAINIPNPTGVNGTITTSTRTYYVVFDYDASAEPGQTHGLSISNAGIVQSFAPLLIRIDLTTRSEIQRSEFNTASTTPALAYRTRRETMFLSPRNFALGAP